RQHQFRQQRSLARRDGAHDRHAGAGRGSGARQYRSTIARPEDRVAHHGGPRAADDHSGGASVQLRPRRDNAGLTASQQGTWQKLEKPPQGRSSSAWDDEASGSDSPLSISNRTTKGWSHHVRVRPPRDDNGSPAAGSPAASRGRRIGAGDGTGGMPGGSRDGG